MATQTFLHPFHYLSIFLLLCCFGTSVAASYCPPSACGIITNISYPFRLKGDPEHCGDRGAELACENDVALLSVNSRKYYVKAILYHNSTIRLVDASLNNTCSFPNYTQEYTINNYGFAYYFRYTMEASSNYPIDYSPWLIYLMSCPYPLKNSSLFTHCASSCSNSSSNPNPNPNPRYTYIKLGNIHASEVPEMCRIDGRAFTAWRFKDLNNATLSEIHHALLYGFEFVFCSVCKKSLPAWVPFLKFYSEKFRPLPFYGRLLIFLLMLISGLIYAPSAMTIIALSTLSLLLILSLYKFYYVSDGHVMVDVFHDMDFSKLAMASIFLAPRVVIFPIALSILIYKFRRRHLSVYDNIESFLRSDNKLAPIRYTYSDIKKMTRGFKDKLGEGGYGSVYKGKLRSGRDIAVKLLRKSGANDQDFMNEISTIGRIHHVNIVTLVGYCAEGSKRALIFDFMPNGSLEKYLFNQEKMNSLKLDIKFEIAVGVARGIDYLHRGCDVQILHFDIKPHNILLDDNFIPKISDFGLAKFCSTDKYTMTMTAARGTIGYVAPELISRSIGVVSYKADVYSFGMLLMEMVSLNKDLIGDKDDSTRYFPYWIYNCFNQEKYIDIENNDEDDSTRSLVRKMTIVALWCIQMPPNDRPSMNKVLKMLEGDIERLQIPDYPSQSTQTIANVDESCRIFSTDCVSSLSSTGVSSCVEITVQE